MTRRVLVLVLVTLAALLGAGPAASAATSTSTVVSTAASSVSAAAVPGIGPDCKGDPPLPASPEGSLGLGPGQTSTADPFTTPGVSIASVYGTNYRWWWYDNGCGAGSGIMPALTTNIANVFGLQIPGLFLALGQGLFTAVIDPSGWIGFLDEPIANATASVAAGVWFPFLTLVLLLVAVVTLTRAARGRLSSTITASVWALTVLVVVTWVVGYPSESVKMLDSGIQAAVITTADGFSPDAQRAGPQATASSRDSERARAVAAMDSTWDTINRSTVYRSWLQGVFGDADSPTATRYGPTVFKATHFTWAEYDTYQRDPAGAGKAIVDRKATDFRRVADQVKAADPLAYQFFTGNRTGDRLGTAFLCLLITIVSTGFFILAGLLTVLGYAVARLIVPATPAAGVLFLLDNFRDLAISWGERVVKFLVMGPLAFLAALVLFAFTDAIFTATMSDGLKYLLIIGLSWLAWRLLRPHTALGKMHVPGKKLLGQVLAMELAVRGRSAHRRGSDDKGDQDDEDDSEEESAGTGSGRSDRMVHTSSRPRPSAPRMVDEEDERDDEDSLGYPAPPRRADVRAAEYVDARTRRWPSAEPADSRPARDVFAREDAASAAQPPREVPVYLVADEAPTWRESGPLRAPHDPSREALPPARGALEGNLLDPDMPLPRRVNEANLTRDEDGTPVFQVYRPEGSRFYVQDE